MTHPVCVRLVRPEPVDQALVHRWLRQSSVHYGAPELDFDGFLNRYPSHYWNHSARVLGRVFLIAVGDQVTGAVVHHAVVALGSGQHGCVVEVWLAGPALAGRGIGAYALEQLCVRLPDELGVSVVSVRPCIKDVRALRACRLAGFTPGDLDELESTFTAADEVAHTDTVSLVRHLRPGPAIERAPDDFDRSQLMSLFRMADDSEASILRYRDQGVLYLLRDGDLVVGQLLVCRHAYAASATIESLSLLKSHRRIGLGTALVRSVLSRLADVGVAVVEVGTAAGDTVNLRFFQALGFRLRTVQRDFFRPPDYPLLLDPEAIPLRDRVVCDIALTSAAVRMRSAPSG